MNIRVDLSMNKERDTNVVWKQVRLHVYHAHSKQTQVKSHVFSSEISFSKVRRWLCAGRRGLALHVMSFALLRTSHRMHLKSIINRYLIYRCLLRSRLSLLSTRVLTLIVKSWHLQRNILIVKQTKTWSNVYTEMNAQTWFLKTASQKNYPLFNSQYSFINVKCAFVVRSLYYMSRVKGR